MDDAENPVNVIQVCGAITNWIGNNPAYCVYELDKETMLPVSRKTYFFDLDKANESGTPDWKLFTDWTKDYGLADMSPASMKKLAERIGSDEATALDYMNRSRRDVTNDGGSCDAGCQLSNSCEASFIDPYRTALCNGNEIYNWTGDFMGSFRQSMLEPWLRELPEEPLIFQ